MRVRRGTRNDARGGDGMRIFKSGVGDVETMQGCRRAALIQRFRGATRAPRTARAV